MNDTTEEPSENKYTQDGKEICVLCKKVTDVDATTHVDLRRYYITGIGQLCKQCYTNYCL